MHRLLKFIFGWDYIYWELSVANGIARVRKAPDGTIWYYSYWLLDRIDKIENKDQVLWLTCLPEKYFPIKNENK